MCTYYYECGITFWVIYMQNDFKLDWELDNHRLEISKQLQKRFNVFHHELHKKYLAYGSHEEALASRTSLVDNLIWVKLCGQWRFDEINEWSDKDGDGTKRLGWMATSECITGGAASNDPFLRFGS